MSRGAASPTRAKPEPYEDRRCEPYEGRSREPDGRKEKRPGLKSRPSESRRPPKCGYEPPSFFNCASIAAISLMRSA